MEHDSLEDQLDAEEAQAAEVFAQLIDPAQPPAPDKQSAKDCYEWQQSRRKPERKDHFNIPITGFGPEGRQTLWLPSPKNSAQWKIVEGRARLVETKTCMEDQILSKMRDEVLLTFRRKSETMFAVAPTFLNYAATLIASNYNVTDDDLNFLLQDGGAWQDGIARHLIGAADTLERVFDLGVAKPIAPFALKVDTSPAPVVIPQAQPLPPKRRRWWLLDYFRR